MNKKILLAILAVAAMSAPGYSEDAPRLSESFDCGAAIAIKTSIQIMALTKLIYDDSNGQNSVVPYMANIQLMRQNTQKARFLADQMEMIALHSSNSAISERFLAVVKELREKFPLRGDGPWIEMRGNQVLTSETQAVGKQQLYFDDLAQQFTGVVQLACVRN